MVVANPREVPEYELNPQELQVRKADGISKARPLFASLSSNDVFGFPVSMVLTKYYSYQGIYQVAKWNGTKVSVKILDKDLYKDNETIEAFKHELTLLEKVRHPNVVQFVGAVTQNVPMMIVSEYHPKGDLGSYLQKKGRLSPSKVLRFSLDIARHMIEGQPFHPKPPEEAVKLMCLEGRRSSSFKAKSKNCPQELRELIEECWDAEAVGDILFLSPPWGGPEYARIKHFKLCMIQPVEGRKLFETALTITRKIIMFLPKNTDEIELESLCHITSPPLDMVIGDNKIDRIKKAITVYYSERIEKNTLGGKDRVITSYFRQKIEEAKLLKGAKYKPPHRRQM
ncbi:Serine-threonine/tyrosine-protein kinase [Hirschfeldia incana]|nr:Serine-threonine/tyrosine-protein kinase [Hirschfeldia incana]